MKPEHYHWSERLAEKVIAEKKEPYVITAGMTTSGPMHFGTLCEMLFPMAIKEALEARGKKAKYYFIADIMDAFDSVPLAMEKYRAQLEPHLGKPLCYVPDPTGKSRSFGDHFLDEARGLMKLFGIDAEVIRVNEYYEQGKFDDWANFYLKHDAEARKIVEETSGQAEKKDWSPIMPICEKCGRIATTRVTKHDGENYEYACDRDVKYTKGCGHNGKNKISDHKYKIVWRLHWPAWKQIFHSTIEGAGIDHHTKGGSEDTCRAITLNLMKREYHIPYRYGFILFQGRKYSKSKGIGMGIAEIVKLLPPEVIKYMLLRPDLEENVDINPTSQKMLRTIEEFEVASKLDADKVGDNRAEKKNAIAFLLSAGKDGIRWTAPFLDILLYYQIYRDWEKVGAMVKDARGAAYLKPYIEEWIAKGFVPDDYDFSYKPEKAEGVAKDFFESLDVSKDAEGIHNAIYDFAKSKGIPGGEVFRALYKAMLGKERGPRLGKLIYAIGVEKVKRDVL